MQTGNILFGFNLGVSTIRVGTYGEAEGTSADVGRSEGGVEFSIEREIKHVETDQDPGPVAAKEIRRVGKLKFGLNEVTLANLAIAFNLPETAVADGVLSLGVAANGELYRTIYINTDGPAGGVRKYVLHKCVASGPAAHAYKKDDKTIVECEFDVLWDTSQGVGEEMGTVTDTGADIIAPTVALSTPVDGQTVTKLTKNPVVWTITETNQVDEASIVYGDTFSIINTTLPASAALVAGTIAYNATAKMVTFTPSSEWTAEDIFQTIVSTGLQDLAGNNLAAAKIEQFSVTA